MKIFAYYALHYGREWLYWSMMSIQSAVDGFVMVYTPKPSYGFWTKAQNPESGAELRAIASLVKEETGKAVHWYDMAGAPNEGSHRDLAIKICRNHGAQIILPIDHDEIWELEHLDDVLTYVGRTRFKDYRIPMQHYYRSLNWVCHDPLAPVRVIATAGTGETTVSADMGKMHHFGYAQSPTIVRYKWRIHGHQAELREGWFENKFLGWQPGMEDVHPTNDGFWTPTPSDLSNLRSMLREHPYMYMPIIDDSVVEALTYNKSSTTRPTFQGKFFGMREAL